jgi:hypothetical protein
VDQVTELLNLVDQLLQQDTELGLALEAHLNQIVYSKNIASIDVGESSLLSRLFKIIEQVPKRGHENSKFRHPFGIHRICS